MTTTPTDGLEALRELWAELVPCICEESYTSRNLIDTGCHHHQTEWAMENIQEHYRPIIEARERRAVRYVEAKHFSSMGPRLGGTGKTFDDVVEETTDRTMEALKVYRA